MQRVAVIFDNRQRPETTGLYVRRALGDLVRRGDLAEIEHLLPSELDSVSSDRFDLFLYVDDGLQDAIPERLRPAAWWAIDTHLGFDRCLRIARQADWTFSAQQNGAEQLAQSGIPRVQWLPLACDPELHARHSLSKRHEICFVGNLVGAERQRLVRLLQQNVPDMLVGQRYFEQMAAVYSASRIVFNRSIRDDLNMRVFEALCSGSLLLTNQLDENGLPRLFRDGVHLATYTDDAELLDKLRFYLANESERERIAENGRQEVLSCHTYRHRIETLLDVVRASHRSTRRTVRASKAPGYFDHVRPDVLQLIPTSARKILDIGCGSGRLGEALRDRQECRVEGIECDARAVASASQRLDAVHSGDIERDVFPFTDATFDCVVLADVLEHLREPVAVLGQVRRWLAPDGCLVTSVPNVRNHTVVQSLLAGNWTYESAGLLDHDHVRFFTRREIEKLLFRSGFDVESLQMVPGEGFAEWESSGRPEQITVGGLQIRAATATDAAEFFAYQYLASARPRQATAPGLTSIVIVTHGQVELTRACVDSIRLRTDEPYELIFVDNASPDGTVPFLRSIEAATVIENGNNRGFPAAVNQGIAAATGRNILLLNNDTVVTTGWLGRMLETLYADAATGLVGPVSNNVSGEQQVPVGYHQMAELDGWAWDWSQAHRGDVVATDRLVGFCLLFRRELVDRIGVLDERFGIGCFEDDDFCRRARAAGFQAVIDRSGFVHHVGSATFRAAGIDFATLMRNNEQEYRNKWSGDSARTEPPLPPAASPARTPRPDYIIDDRSDREDGLRLRPNTVRVSACLIVRDNESTIRPCLESLRPWVDEIVVVDTGSQDATIRLCEQLGARVFEWAWRDDFAAARNVSIERARGEWIFWMDSDDTIPEACGQQLRQLADGEHPANILGYVMQVHCPGDEPHDLTIVDHVKLFRNRPDLRFEFRIHEQILPAIRRAGGDVAFTDIHVVHSGSDRSPEGRQRKLKRDFHLLHLELRDRPDHPFVLFNLGMTHADAGEHVRATECLARCLDVSAPGESHVRKAFALAVGSLATLERFEAADAMCRRGLRQFPDDKELLFRQAMLQHEAGQLEQAAATYRRLLEERTDRHFASVDPGITGYKARHNLAVICETIGQWSQAREQWEHIVAESPDYRPGWKGLVAFHMQHGDEENGRKIISELQRDTDLCVIGHILATEYAQRHHDAETSLASLKSVLQRVPHDYDAHDAYCRILFEAGRFTEAVPALCALARIKPADAAVHHNLAVAYAELGALGPALASCRRSLDLRPESPSTRHLFDRLRAEPHLPAEDTSHRVEVIAANPGLST
ncbi:SPBc2 prophage-derived glycosyltransferase SunS [Maioricimonas rarisocia]|uniref:SPBc2 prophage-derived glycosyltransferase SunS n=1 Tax=Maioricimonas rarisocia TaxID=2528026 RepID=A0A517ZB55_9PLAN|nr:glycosyltransferase [Maioricimonas rarisocia]QDU39660.1 SPBc2 prophage-derived glycosyltransferase SunS [Maioricimonas rarisocia]